MPEQSKKRQKFMLEGVYKELLDLQRENECLKVLVRERIKPLEVAEMVLKEAESEHVDIYLRSSVLMDEADEFRERLRETPPTNKKSRSPVARRYGKMLEEGDEEISASGRENSIPKVISMLNLDDCKPRKKQVVFHEEVDNLADALAGNFAF